MGTSSRLANLTRLDAHSDDADRRRLRMGIAKAVKIIGCRLGDYSLRPWTMIVEQRVGGYKHSGDIAFPIREYVTDFCVSTAVAAVGSMSLKSGVRPRFPAVVVSKAF